MVASGQLLGTCACKVCENIFFGVAYCLTYWNFGFHSEAVFQILFKVPAPPFMNHPPAKLFALTRSSVLRRLLNRPICHCLLSLLGGIPLLTNAAVIPKVGWSVRYVSSQETVGSDTAATRAIDGSAATFWHSKWFNGADPAPHELQLDLGATFSINQFRYLPRQDSSNGRVGGYRLFVSQNGTNWGAPVAEGTFLNNSSAQTVTFPATAGRYFSIFVLNDVGGGSVASIGEIDLFGNPLTPSRNEAPDSIIVANPSLLLLPVGGQADFSGIGLDVDGGQPFSFLWNFGVGSMIPNSTLADPPPVVFNAPGEYLVTFTVTDSGGLSDSRPDSVRVKVGPSLLDRSPWSVWFVDSEESVGSNGLAENAFDSMPNTIWHTKWFNGTTPIPHEVQIDLGSAFTLSEFRYLPRQDNANGRIKDFRFFVSQDGQNWGAPIATGSFPNAAGERIVPLPPTSGRYVALSADSEVNGGQITTAAELNLFGQPAVPAQMNLVPDGVITSHPSTSEIAIGPGGMVNFSGIGLDLNIAQPLTYSWNFGANSGITSSTLVNPPPVQYLNEGTFITTFTVSDAAGASDVTPDTRVVKVGVASIPNTAWSLISASSQETVGSSTGAVNLFDGNTNTFWHSRWLNGPDAVPHEVILDLGSTYTLSAFTYLPRQDSANGRIGNYAFYVGQSATNWGSPAATGTFPAGAALRTIPFTSVSGRYVRLVSFGDLNGGPYSAVAELGLRGFRADSTVNQAPDGIITSPTSPLALPPNGNANFAGLALDPNDGQALTYVWDFGIGSGVPASTDLNPRLITFPNPGNYEVTFSVTDALGLADPTPAKIQVTIGTGRIARSSWTIHNASSQQTQGIDLSAAKTIDGNPATFWHSQYSPVFARPPHTLEYNLGSNKTITGLEYLPRQDLPNGRVSNFEITVSQDGVNWGAPAATDVFVNSAARQSVTIPPTSGRYVRLTTFKDVNGADVSSIAEVDLLGYDASLTSNLPPDSIINSPSGNISLSIGDSVNFAGLGLDLNSGQSLTYQWTFGAGSGIQNSTLSSPGSRQFNNAGTYQITLTATDSLGLADPTPATMTITVGDIPLNKANFVIRSVSSVETVGNLPASNAIDGNPNTFWHTRYTGGTDPLPHEIVVDLGTNYTVSAMRYLPRQDLPNGRIGAYQVILSQDGVNFGGPAASGTFATSAGEKIVQLVPTTGRYVMLRSFGDINGLPATTVAELDFSGVPASNTANRAPDGVINTPNDRLSVGVGTNVNFTSSGMDSDGNLPLTYLWNFGANSGLSTSTLKNPGNLQFINPGTYLVTLTVTDSAGLADPTPHVITVFVGSSPLSRAGWLVTQASSQETSAISAPVTNAFDGNPATFWHTKYSGGLDAHPHSFTIDLGGNFITAGFNYLARQDASNGRIAGYQFFVSQDGSNWGAPAGSGVLTNSTALQTINFTNPVAGRYVRFITLSDVNGSPIATMAEFNILGQAVPASINQAPDGVINSPSSEVSINAGGMVNFTGTALDIEGNAPLGYQWNFGIGSGITPSALRNPGTIQFNNVGVFTVSLTVTDSIGLADPTPHTINVIVAAANGVIAQNTWSVLASSPVETTAINGQAANAFDGNPETFWHTRYTGGTIPIPHTIDIDLGAAYVVSEFRYLARQDLSNGRIAKFALHFSRDGINWGAPVAEGEFPNSTALQTIKLPSLPARFFRLSSSGDVNGNPISSVAEMSLIGQPRSGSFNTAPYGRILNQASGSILNTKTGDAVQFAATALDFDGDLPLTYRWNFGSNSGIPEQTNLQPSPVVYNNPGDHMVTFTVTDSRGAVGSTIDSRTVRVQGGGPTNLAPNGTINYPYSEIAIPAGGSVDLVGIATDPNGNLPLSYIWEFGAGSGISNQTLSDPSAVQYNVIGTYVIRLTVADSLGLADPTPATLTVRVGSNSIIPRATWKLAFVDSQETAGGFFPASNILDGNPATFWHTAYTGTPVPNPHEFQIDLAASHPVSGFRYLPRQDLPNGRVAAYRFFVSNDGITWGSPVAQGTFVSSVVEQQILFSTRVCRYVRFVADSDVFGSIYTSMAEFNVLQTPVAVMAAPASAIANVPEAAGYRLVYQVNPAITNDYSSGVPYITNNSAAHLNGTFDRVAYYVELDSKWVWVSFDALSASAADIGIPTTQSSWQSRKLSRMNIFASGNSGLTTGSAISTGNIEFWPTNYGTETSPSIPGGSGSTFDFNDTFANFGNYGSMQLHNHGASQTLFAFNNWNTSSTNSDLGIGNSPGTHSDWTNANNAATYTTRRVYALVRPGAYVGQADVSYTALPKDKGLVPRNPLTNKATVPISGKETRGGFDSARLRVFRLGVPYGPVLTQALTYNAAEASFTFAPTIDAELAEYDFVVSMLVGPTETQVTRVAGIVAGDAFIVNGQSNADAQRYTNSAFTYENPYLRTFGINATTAAGTVADLNWKTATGDGSQDRLGGIGQWALVMGNLMVSQQNIPIAILNAAHGGQEVGFFQRDDANPENLNSNYGRMLYRTRQAGLSGGIRGAFFYQGEADFDSASAHELGYRELRADWKRDYPSLRNTFVFQVREGCGVTRFEVDLRDAQRRLADRFADTTILSSNGLNSHDGCHFGFTGGYEVLGFNTFGQVQRSLYGGPSANVDPPNPASVQLVGTNQLKLTFRSVGDTYTFQSGAQADFKVIGAPITVTGGAVTGNELLLNLSGNATSATRLNYGGRQGAGQWVTNSKGIGMLSFSEPILPP